jgi:hypothetical protein
MPWHEQLVQIQPACMPCPNPTHKLSAQATYTHKAIAMPAKTKGTAA